MNLQSRDLANSHLAISQSRELSSRDIAVSQSRDLAVRGLAVSIMRLQSRCLRLNYINRMVVTIQGFREY